MSIPKYHITRFLHFVLRPLVLKSRLTFSDLLNENYDASAQGVGCAAMGAHSTTARHRYWIRHSASIYSWKF